MSNTNTNKTTPKQVVLYREFYGFIAFVDSQVAYVPSVSNAKIFTEAGALQFIVEFLQKKCTMYSVKEGAIVAKLSLSLSKEATEYR